MDSVPYCSLSLILVRKLHRTIALGPRKTTVTGTSCVVDRRGRASAGTVLYGLHDTFTVAQRAPVYPNLAGPDCAT